MDNVQVFYGQAYTAPFRSASDDENYNMQVLRLQALQKEEDLDQHFLSTALNLGINVPQDPTTTLDIVTSNLSNLAVSPTPELFSLPSRSSDLTHPTSCGSSDQQLPVTKASSVTTSSVQSATPSIISNSSTKSSYSRFRKSLRRLSAFSSKRGRIDPDDVALMPSLPILQAMAAARSTSGLTEDAEEDRLSSRSSLPPLSPSVPRRAVGHVLPEVRQLGRPERESVEDPESEETLAARQRSVMSQSLNKLRLKQLGEQDRFINYQTERLQLIRKKQADEKRQIRDRHHAQQLALRNQHAETLTEFETRHLNAEVELERNLELERQACETKIKYMEGYCNTRNPTAGMPARKITDADYKKLVHQYQLRAGMDNLHEGRIHVLREKQAKQLQRVSAKQDAELEKADAELEKELEEVDNKYNAEEEDLRDEFAEHRRRLVAKWDVAESLERAKLEQETGEMYGPLPTVVWGDEKPMHDRERPLSEQFGVYDYTMGIDGSAFSIG